MAAWQRYLPAGLFVFIALGFVPAEEPKKDKPAPPDPLPDVFKMFPKIVVLSQEKYKELLADAERFRKTPEAGKLLGPNHCRLTGKLEAGHAHLTVTFTLVPRQAGLIPLGCGKKVHVISGTLDGKPAPLRSENDGLFVLLDGSAEEPPRLVLELAVPIQPKGSGRFFELDLPRHASNRLELELPPGLKEVRVGDQALTTTTLPALVGNRIEGTLGQIERLVVSWREPQVVAGPLLLTAEGVIEASVDEKQQLSTTATLTLNVKSGQTSSWRVLVPPGAELKVAPEWEDRIRAIDTTDQPFASLRTIQLKEPTSESLTLTVRVPPRGPLPRGGTRAPVGPFAVQGAVRQTGTLLVKSNARDVQIQRTLAAETTPRPLTPDEQKLAPAVFGYKYERVPLPEKVTRATGPGSYTLLDLEAESVSGTIETQTSHVVRLPRLGDPRLWKVATTLKARLVQPGVEWLAVQLPPQSKVLDLPKITAPVLEVKEDAGVLRLRLKRDEWKEFTTTFNVQYEEPAGSEGTALFALPQPQETTRSGDFAVEVWVPDDVELIVPEKPNPTLTLVSHTPQNQVWKPDPTEDRLQEQIALAWRRYRPEVRVDSTVELTLTPRDARVQHELRVRQGRAAQGQVPLLVPRGMTRPTVVRGGKLTADAERLLVQLDPTTEAESLVVLTYSSPIPDPAQPAGGRNAFTVPLVQAESATAGKVIVHVYSDPGRTPLAESPGWDEPPLREVPGAARLPVLTVATTKLDAPLSLRFAEVQGQLPAVVARRALIRVEVKEGQGQFVRASYYIQQVTGRSLDVELPVRVAELSEYAFTLDGVRIDPDILDEKTSERNTEAGKIARLRLPAEALTRPLLLDVQYRLFSANASPYATVLQPPTLSGDPGRLLVRWSVTLPGGWVALGPEEGPGTRRTWTRRGVLFVSRPAESQADLEAWLTGGDAGAQDAAFANPALVCWRTGVQKDLTIYHLSQQVWLLVCSLVILALGLGFVFWWRRVVREERSPYGLLVGVVVAVLVPVLASLWFPTTVQAVALGAEPGAAVLLLVVVLQAVAHERERRRRLFLPSFSRKQPVSAVVRPTTPAQQPRTEPSTVDAAPVASGSQGT